MNHDQSFGTTDPAYPTDEFVREAFARGAKDLWRNSQDPGWWTTFDRWLSAHDDTERDVTRVTLVDEEGVVFERYNLSSVEHVYQDDGRTLKIFINKDD